MATGIDCGWQAKSAKMPSVQILSILRRGAKVEDNAVVFLPPKLAASLYFDNVPRAALCAIMRGRNARMEASRVRRNEAA